MRSGIGPRDELAALGIKCQVNLPGVGRNLIDHPMVFVVAAADAGNSTRSASHESHRYSLYGDRL